MRKTPPRQQAVYCNRRESSRDPRPGSRLADLVLPLVGSAVRSASYSQGSVKCDPENRLGECPIKWYKTMTYDRALDNA